MARLEFSERLPRWCSEGKRIFQSMHEMGVKPLGLEDPLEQEMATCSSILGWKIPWTEESGRLQSMESQRVGHDRVTEHRIK